MSTCSKCGNPITFRYVGGCCVPLHLSGGCINTGSRSKLNDYSGYSRSDESCCFLTNCPECGFQVFFIRYNGGSVWIDPPLGPPWYKHPCMDREYTPIAGTRSSLVSKKWFLNEEVNTGLILGVVKESMVSFSKQCTITCIETEKNDRHIILVKHNAGFLTGKLVIFSPDEKSVALFDNAKYAYGVIAIIDAPSGIGQQIEKISCPECHAALNPKSVKSHFRNQHWSGLMKYVN